METANEQTHTHLDEQATTRTEKPMCSLSLSRALFLPLSCQESCHFSPSACLSFSFHHHKLTRVMYASKTFIFSSFLSGLENSFCKQFSSLFSSPRGRFQISRVFHRKRSSSFPCLVHPENSIFFRKAGKKGEKEKFFSSRKDKRTHARTHGQQVPSASRDRFATTDPRRRSRNPKLHGPLDQNSLP